MKKEEEDNNKTPEQLNLNEPPLFYQTGEQPIGAIEEEPGETFEEARAEALTPEEFMKEMEERIRKW